SLKRRHVLFARRRAYVHQKTASMVRFAIFYHESGLNSSMETALRLLHERSPKQLKAPDPYISHGQRGQPFSCTEKLRIAAAGA
ncbi:MAG: hypothetical protein IK056_04100, partial [Clostridia bacterium]|nr:hypothetical protein [Clostridia bacterium]